jgi:hypothetical protein
VTRQRVPKAATVRRATRHAPLPCIQARSVAAADGGRWRAHSRRTQRRPASCRSARPRNGRDARRRSG